MRPSRGVTLIEVVISSTVLSVVFAVFLGVLESAGEASNLVHTQTDTQLRAETALRTLRDELRHAGVGGGSDLELDLTPSAPGAAWEIRYNRLEGGPLFDPTATDPYATLPWSKDRFTLRFERVDDPSNGEDDDGDLLLDEGRLALYRTPAGGGTAELVTVLAMDLADVRVELQFDVRPRLHLEVDVEQVLRTALNGMEDLAVTRAGGGPRLRHTADIWLALPN
jgi:prepilin-type N-terminal cleavage/methylation domain-containing protein